MDLAVVWDDRFRDISFSHPMIREQSKERIRRFIELAREKLSFVELKPELAEEGDLLEIHSPTYIKTLKEKSSLPYIGFLDEGDTVHYPGVFEDVLLVLGATKTALRASAFFDKIYVPLGGFHHATFSRPMGFCPINDVAYLVKKLLERGERVAIVDVDAHHANGLQEYFYRERVLKINVFAYDGKFFPGTGRPEERGEGKGNGLNYNMGLPLGAGDDAFELALALLDRVEEFDPTYIVAVAGVDGHKDDYLHSLNLSCNSFNLLGLKLRHYGRGRKVIAYGGGGYGKASAECMVSFLMGLTGRREALEGRTTSPDEVIETVKERLAFLLSQ